MDLVITNLVLVLSQLQILEFFNQGIRFKFVNFFLNVFLLWLVIFPKDKVQIFGLKNCILGCRHAPLRNFVLVHHRFGVFLVVDGVEKLTNGCLEFLEIRDLLLVRVI